MIETKFKNTEIGLIPEDWEVKTIGEIKSKEPNAFVDGPFGSNLKSVHYVPNGDVYVVESGFITTGKFIYKEFKTITKEHFETIKRSECKENDIIIAKIGANYGMAGILPRLNKKSVISGNSLKLTLNYSIVDNHYFLYQYLNKKESGALNDYVHGNAQPALSLTGLNTFPIPLPPLPEQRRIAEVLSQADELIKQWENVIAKKRDIKTGTMQLLLTGKKRLNGFDKPWVEKKLGEVLQYEQPTKYLVSSTEYVDSGVPVLTAGKTFILGYTNENYGIYDNLPVIIFDDFTTESKFVNFKFKAKSSAMKMLTLKNEDNDFYFIYLIMQIIDFPLTDHQRYWISEYSNITVLLPSLSEQRAIAEILSDMDEEIKTLEAKVEKLRNIKSGMMQQLLSGKIRLTGDDAGNVRQFVENNFGQMPYAAEDEAEFGL